MVNNDAARLEMYEIGLAAKCDKLLALLQRDLDIHSYNAYLQRGKATGKESVDGVQRLLQDLGRAGDAQRDPAKSHWYAWQYGAGDPRIGITILEETEGEVVLSAQELSTMRGAIETAYPEIPQWWRTVREEARRTMRVTNEWGRPRILFAGDTHGVPPNTVIQSTGADWVNGILVRVDQMTAEGRRRGGVINHGWDSLLDETPDALESIKIFAEEFSRPIRIFDYTVSMPWEMARGTHWGDLEKVKV